MATLIIVALRASARCVILPSRLRRGLKGLSPLFPHHRDTTNLSFSKCYPCSRSDLLPMFPVAQADYRAWLRDGAESHVQYLLAVEGVWP